MMLSGIDCQGNCSEHAVAVPSYGDGRVSVCCRLVASKQSITWEVHGRRFTDILAQLAEQELGSAVAVAHIVLYTRFSHIDAQHDVVYG